MLHATEPEGAACLFKAIPIMPSHRFLLVFVAIGLNLSACRSGSDYFLKSGYTEIEDHAEVRQVRGERIPGSDLYDAAKIAVYDSLCIFYSWKIPNGFYAVLDMHSGKDLGIFCPKGRGPIESTGLAPIHDLRQRDGALRAEIIDAHRQRLLVWNVTESLLSGGTVYDTILPVAKRILPQWFARAGENRYFFCSSPMPFENIGEVVVPRYTLTSLPDLSDLRKYEVFTDSILSISSSGKWLMPDFVSMEYGMKPDGSKVVMAMSYSPQINVLDLASGSLAYYRLKGLPRESTSRRIWYYASVCCDDNYIYALYNALDLHEPIPEDRKSMIHVFDWEGTLCGKAELDGLFNQIYLDRNMIYGWSAKGFVSAYKVSDLLE